MAASKTIAGKTLGNAEDPKQKDEQDSDDEYQLPEKILIHDENEIQNN